MSLSYRSIPTWLLIPVVGFLIIVIPFSAVAQPTDIPNWNISWFDEFDGNTLDTNKWNAIHSNAPTNNSRHAYRAGQVTVSGGNLVITSENIPTGGLPYRSGQVISTDDWHYGRFEVRGRLPTSRGMWPAIWLLPDVQQYPWPSQGEIDIMENRGDEPLLTSSAFHWGTVSPFNHYFRFNNQRTTTGTGPVNYHNNFHTYAAEWDSSQVRFYVDDVHHFTVIDADTDGFLSSQSAGMNMVLNTAVGGDFLDDPDGTTIWPQTFEIDYVHIYERAVDAWQLELDNGSFEQDGGSLAHWSTFGNVIPNVGTSAAFSNDGTESVKLFGQFNGSGFNYSGVQQGLTVSSGQTVVADVDAWVSSDDSIANTENVVHMKIDYFSVPHGIYGTSSYIGSQQIVVANAATVNNVWHTHQLSSVVPAGAVEARLALVFTQKNFDGGAVYLDDARIRIEPETTPALARKLLDGVESGGSLADSIESDDTYYVLDPSPTGNLTKQRVEMVLLTETPVSSPTSFAFRCEAAMPGGSAGDVIQEIEIWNNANKAWELLDTRPVEVADNVVEISASGDLSDYVHPLTGETIARISWQSPSFSGTPFAWSIDIDQAVWLIEGATSKRSSKTVTKRSK